MFRVYFTRTIMILGHSTTSFDLSLIIYAFGNPLWENNTRTWIRFRICFLSDIRCEFSEPVHRSSCSSIACVSFVNWIHRLRKLNGIEGGIGTRVFLFKVENRHLSCIYIRHCFLLLKVFWTNFFSYFCHVLSINFSNLQKLSGCSIFQVI